MARQHFSAKELADLSWAVVAINGWNRASRPYFSVLRNSSKLCGSTSGTTCTCVVNLYGALSSPLSNTSSTKNAVQPDAGFATRPTYTPLSSAFSGDDLYALPIVTSRKSRALG